MPEKAQEGCREGRGCCTPAPLPSERGPMARAGRRAAGWGVGRTRVGVHMESTPRRDLLPGLVAAGEQWGP